MNNVNYMFDIRIHKTFSILITRKNLIAKSAQISYIRRNKNLLNADERLKDNLFVIRNVESGSCVVVAWTMVVIGFVIELHDDERFSCYSFVRGISMLSDLKSPH